MNKKDFLLLAEDIINNRTPDNDAYKEILQTPDNEIMGLLNGADLIRNHFFGNKIHLCTIFNGKSGRCSEDCRFCTQSAFYSTDSPVYPLMEKDELMKGGLHAAGNAHKQILHSHYRQGASSREVKAVAEAMAALTAPRIGRCASLGVLDEPDLKILKDAGVNRYHHNLETSRSYFPEVCTTHTYEERINTILAAKRIGMEVCSGGIFGIGETDDQIIEMAVDTERTGC